MHFTDPKALLGLHVIGREDVTLGVVEDVYADIRTGRPQWAAIRSGLFGTDVSLVPLAGAEHNVRSLRVPYGTRELRNAPHRAPGIMMTHKEEANLFRYYGFSGGSAGPLAGKPAGPRQAGSGHGAGRTMLHKYTGRPPD
jgi:PRC-barrel domain protein